MRILQVIDERSGRELGSVLIHDDTNIYQEIAHPTCHCGRKGPECQTPGEALDELLDHIVEHNTPVCEQRELPWAPEF